MKTRIPILVALLGVALNINAQTVSDIDGNVYNTVSIGTQIWMAENLKTTKYQNEDIIATTNHAPRLIGKKRKPKYQWAYEGKEVNVETYGRLYTWHVVTDSRNVCPTGWHVPSDAEWKILTDYLTNNAYGYEGSGSDIGKSMASSFGWVTDTTAGTIGNDQANNNSSGFTGFPGGYRYYDGSFSGIGFYIYWWSTTEYTSELAYNRGMHSSTSNVNRYGADKEDGFSVRCLRD